MKPEFAKYLQQDSILIADEDGSKKKDVLESIVQHAATRCTLDENQIRDLVWKREGMMTTGVGCGLALPHIRVNGFPSPLVIVVVAKDSIPDYKSLDDKPIRLVVFLAADERDSDAYLKLLGSISCKLKEPGIIDEIISVGEDKAKIQEILSR